jgi:hypothetical protein
MSVGFNSQAAYSGWNDCGLAGQFYRNLPNRIKDQFQFVDKPNTLSGVRNFATTFDDATGRARPNEALPPRSKKRLSPLLPKTQDNSRPATNNTDQQQQLAATTTPPPPPNPSTPKIAATSTPKSDAGQSSSSIERQN